MQRAAVFAVLAVSSVDAAEWSHPRSQKALQEANAMKEMMDSASKFNFDDDDAPKVASKALTRNHRQSADIPARTKPLVSAATMAAVPLAKRPMDSVDLAAEQKFDGELLSHADRELEDLKEQTETKAHPKKSLLAARSEQSQQSRADRYFAKFGMTKVTEMLGDSPIKVEQKAEVSTTSDVDNFHSRWEEVDKLRKRAPQ